MTLHRGNAHSRGRVLIAKPGLDGHTRGAKFIAKALSDHGYDVIFTGIRRTPTEIAAAAVQEDVDVVGLSLLSGAHNKLFPEVVAKMREYGAADIPVIVGGLIPQQDIQPLLAAGIAGVFTSGTPVKDIMLAFEKACSHRRIVE